MEEENWYAEHGITILPYGHADYPCRLLQCADAPRQLYTHATANLNATHTLGIVGTRHITPYGKDVITQLLKDIAAICPDCLIVSGLAYGVDINTHRAAMNNGLPTVAVVAHGPDTVYPAAHRREAEEMTRLGGDVISEYPIRTAPVARNFLQRNRIIAGMSDAVIVIESAHHGGALVTARCATQYGRPVFAIPGPVNAPYSEGCNNLIRDGKATLITSATQIARQLNWQQKDMLAKARQQGIEREIFPELPPEEQAIADILRQRGDMHVNAITMATSLDTATVNAALFSMEMKGVIRSMPGNVYHIIS